jgi:hypothetical protein
MIVVLLVVIGIVGAWVGYWAGHALGWTSDAIWPYQIGGGDRAIGLSILASFGSVMAGVGWFVARPLLQIRRLIATGMPGHATIRRVYRTGLFMGRGLKPDRHELGFELQVHPQGASDYEATALGILSDAEEADLRPGVEVTVRYDPAHPSSVAVVGPIGS